jgi:hypothetical protein
MRFLCTFTDKFSHNLDAFFNASLQIRLAKWGWVLGLGVKTVESTEGREREREQKENDARCSLLQLCRGCGVRFLSDSVAAVLTRALASPASSFAKSQAWSIPHTSSHQQGLVRALPLVLLLSQRRIKSKLPFPFDSIAEFFSHWKFGEKKKRK